MNPTFVTQFRDRARTENETLFPATIRIGDLRIGTPPSADIPCSTGGLRHAQQVVPGMLFQQEIINFRLRKTLLDRAGIDLDSLLGKDVVWIEASGKETKLLITAVNNSAELFYTLGCSAPAQ